MSNRASPLGSLVVPVCALVLALSCGGKSSLAPKSDDDYGTAGSTATPFGGDQANGGRRTGGSSNGNAGSVSASGSTSGGSSLAGANQGGAFPNTAGAASGGSPISVGASPALPDGLDHPALDSFLAGRGPKCTTCAYVECGPVALCLADSECSRKAECAVFCAGRTDEARSACELSCFFGNEGERASVVAGWACVGTSCCSECDIPCP
jgi:hypothetical protein